ncbi:probable sodium/metabolite cotransporter BASS5, chloroplastic [Drosophila pseudoobscura]|uniref:Probable sodium/metabolite cotransporter BASS5, chloroplastic n=1 Tax=Drosophila pseudoobscura pseudoobscura TaxID=46245 RepID=A0A6I8V0I3_DROPS|nr:probable sodium/metabolite cotransporter BASS5, chloroplastic [Drosophila pseudoobscura]
MSNTRLQLLALVLLGIGGVQGKYGDLAGNWLVDYGQAELRLLSDESKQLQLHIYDVHPQDATLGYHFVVRSRDDRRAVANQTVPGQEFDASGSWLGTVNVTGKRFGYSDLLVELHSDGGAIEAFPQPLSIAVLRERVIDERITTYVSAALALLMFLNLGTVLDLQRLQDIVCRPVGPVVGIVSRFVVMPALGFGLGRALWPGQQPLQLALFYTALAPSGGLANVCAVFLKGNINLSIATTTINSLLAIAFMPLWIMVLGRLVYDDDELTVPFGQLSGGAAALVACLAVGLLLRLCVPKTTRFIFRFLKPLSVLLSLSLVGLTVGLNWFVFAEFTWQVLVAALCLPLAGYLATYLLSKLLCRSATDALTLAIETSVLNMTMPIVLLQASQLEQPQLDLVLVVPITASLLSLVLVIVFYGVRRCLGWNVRQDEHAFDHKQLIAEHDEAVYQRP